MQQVKLVVETHFDAAHNLPDYIGQCANLHGHTWKVKIEIIGFPNEKTGMLVDFKKIKAVIDEFDHKYINNIIENPTAENLAIYIKNKMEDLEGVQAARITLWESPNCFVEA